MTGSFIAINFAMISAFIPVSGVNAQSIDHWESMVAEDDQWHYSTPVATIPSTWMQPGFNDVQWLIAQGGFGFGDSDDQTITPGSVPSVLIRTAFTVADASQFVSLILAMDYDDGFVAYLNGTEVARSNLGTIGQPVDFDEFAVNEHEAQLYQGGVPEQYTVPIDLLFTGSNVLAVQVHNRSTASSDITCRPFLLAGVTVPDGGFGPVPTWFTPPIELVTHLPIIRISTNGQAIPDSPRIVAQMDIIDNGPGNLNHHDDPPAGYTGLINIEVRGSSSQGFPKKQYALETQDSAGGALNVSLLNMPEENDWILHAPYSDKTLMRNFLTYDLWNRMGNYTTRTRYCEVLLNGDYQGIYVLMEQVKWDKDRVDIEKTDTNDIAGDSLTGGYIIKVDKITSSGQIDWYSHIPDFEGVDNAVGFQYDYPKRSVVTIEQGDYIQQFMADFEDALVSDSFASPQVGYRRYADVSTFIDFFLIQEITKNVDGYRLSTFLNKQRDSRGGKLRMGPAWDFNITLGNADYCGGESYEGWALNFPCGLESLPFWWRRMNQDTAYIEQLICRYNALREAEWDSVRIFQWIDSSATYLGPAIERNFDHWPILGTYVWPNYYIGQSYQDEVDYLKYWIGQRIAWLDASIPVPTNTCTSDMSGAVVVSEINHSSSATIATGDWIELHNISATDADLSMWRLRDRNPFNDYELPFGTVLGPDERIVISRDPAGFNAIHIDTVVYAGPIGFGLNEQIETVTLFDPMGNTVLSFDYLTQFPWPSGANGTGRTMEHVGGSADPGSPSSWFIGCMGGSPGRAYVPCVNTSVADDRAETFAVYPNPATDVVRVLSEISVSEARLTDVSGRVLSTLRPQSASFEMEIGQMASGSYLLTLTGPGSIIGNRMIMIGH